ncbi:MAG: hypothetical protein WB507_04935, partial [Solirubrobacterales bacterium]
IPQDPVFAKTPPQTYSGNIEVAGGEEEFLRFPAVSADGSHILISTATAGTTVCRNGGEIRVGLCPRFTATPVHLYMRVEDMVTHEIAEGKPVTFVGMTPDGSKVFFTSEEHLTPEDPEHVGASLYMWSEQGEKEGHPLTLISKSQEESQPGGSGNTGDCHPALRNGVPWTTSCSAVPISTYLYSFLTGGAGGNGFSDSAISANGDIYFYSPEQLVGSRGISGAMNLYDYIAADEELKYVTSFTPAEECAQQFFSLSVNCRNDPISRIQVTPNDSRAAFITPDQITSYSPTDPNGYCSIFHFGNETTGGVPVYRNCEEMYTYEPSTGKFVCVSCNPTGAAPTHDVSASTQGLFMSDDGRTFFSTVESLVQTDTNEVEDVYEYVEGRPQLITTGTDAADRAGRQEGATGIQGGFAGVSANGVNAYFSTRDTLVPEDRNGQYIKFYDARINGGFPIEKPPLPCESADECHGVGSSSPTLPHSGTVANLGSGGNAVAASQPKHHRPKTHKRRPGRRHRRRGGSK